MSETDRFYVKLFRNGDLGWLGLSGLTRGLYDELLLLADRAGRIGLGRGGLRALEVPMREPWSKLEGHVRALLDAGAITHEGDSLVITGFEADQARPKTVAERVQKHRAKKNNVPAADVSQKRDVTPSNDRNACNATDQIRSDQTKQTAVQKRAPAHEPADCAQETPANPDAAKILDRIRSHPELAPIASVALAERLAGLCLAGKTLEAILLSIDELADKAAAAALAGAPWSAEHMGGRALAFGRNANGPRHRGRDTPRVQTGETDWSKEADVVGERTMTPAQVLAEQRRRNVQQGTGGPPRAIRREGAPDDG